jgi:tRNA(fMet)-specific endonuclease VapC
MKLLDSDHVTILRMPHSARREKLLLRLETCKEPVGIPVVVVEEVMRGWLAAIAKERDARRQVYAYRELAGLFGFFAKFAIIDFEDAAAVKFDELRKAKIRIPTRDLKIAATALTSDSPVITANRRDFEKVPGLRFENWLD